MQSLWDLLQSFGYGWPYHVLFALIGTLLVSVWWDRAQLRAVWVIVSVSILVIVFGVLYEWYQGFQSDWLTDMLGNIVGMVLGFVLWGIIAWIYERYKYLWL